MTMPHMTANGVLMKRTSVPMASRIAGMPRPQDEDQA
jgi:hypothetical protein